MILGAVSYICNNMAMYTPALLARTELNRQQIERDDLVAIYYYMGYTVDEIVGFLALRHSIGISTRQVHRLLRNRNLRRRLRESNLEDIVRAVMIELSGSGTDIGYRTMRQRLMLYHNLVATNETVRQTLSVLDYEGVLTRSRRRMHRLTYYNKGPNFAYHVDGWDKLKPYGLSVHGCVDGFSRRVLWLEACNSNKNPMYIAHFYLKYVETISGVPVILRGDRGTEKILLYVTCSMP